MQKKNFIDAIKNIYHIKKIIKKYLIDEIAIEILKNCTMIDNNLTINNYNKKFYYIYNKNKKYYQNHKLVLNKSDINLSDIAIINLYILSKLRRNNGIYILVKYLLQ